MSVIKINCAIIVDSLKEQEQCLVKFNDIENKNFFTFDKNIKNLNLLKSKKNFFAELELFYNKSYFFVLHPDEEIALWDEEESFKSHYNLIVDKWIIKSKRSNSKSNEISKIFVKSSFKNIKKFNDDWCHVYSDKGLFLPKLEEYIFVNDPAPNELFLVYQYVYEKLKNNNHTLDLNEFIQSMVKKHPTFVELTNLWGDYLYELNLFSSAKNCYENAIKMAESRKIYDFLPMIPSMHKNHPEKMLANINNILAKYDVN